MKQSKVTRPPIVAVLGHVDHGKTTLLSKIKEEDLTRKEAGGITQSIGAWQVETKEGKKITFIDTPGHEAFRQMRSRGAQVADIVVLVVAADDGVMPQTRESLEHIREANIPFLVAITKIDLKNANPESVRNQLKDERVILEGRGGDIVSVEVSGVTGQGIDELLEMILLLSEMNEISADPEGELEAPVIETQLDRRRGPVVRVIIRNGTLRIGVEVEAGGVQARVRGLFDENRKSTKEALPGMPVEVLGFSRLPPVGSVLQSARQAEIEPRMQEKRVTRKIEGLPIVLKADTAGSLEALENKLRDKVSILVKGVGDVTENDLQLAQPATAPVIGLNVRADRQLKRLAEEEGVPIHIYKVIYELLDDVDRWVQEKEEKDKEKILGIAEILAEFPSGKKRIAGCRVSQGRIAKNDKLRLRRGGQILGNVRPISMKKQKDEISEARQGEEFGILFEPQFDFKVQDVLESYRRPAP